MNAAKEWSINFKAIEAARPAPFSTVPTDRPERSAHAQVMDDGSCLITLSHYGRLDPDIAIQLARWILATFGDAEGTEPRP